MQQNTDLTTLLFQLFNKVNANEHTHGQKPLTFTVNNTAYTVSLAECHVLDYIARHDKTNAISIAAASGITRGGISKITARLEQKGLLTVTAAPDNKKMLSYTNRTSHLQPTSANTPTDLFRSGKNFATIHSRRNRLYQTLHPANQ